MSLSMKFRPQGLAPRGVDAPWAPARDRSIPLMPAHACSLVWRGTFWSVFYFHWCSGVPCFGCRPREEGNSLVIIWYTLRHLGREMQQWFMKRFD